MLAPPSLDGAVQDNEACVLPAVADSAVGAPGVVGRTRTEAEFDEYDPVPTEFTAATLKIYDVLLVSPVTVALVEVLVPSANVVQVDPLFDEY